MYILLKNIYVFPEIHTPEIYIPEIYTPEIYTPEIYIFSEKENIGRIAVNIYSLALAISIIPSPAPNTQTEGRIFREGKIRNLSSGNISLQIIEYFFPSLFLRFFEKTGRRFTFLFAHGFPFTAKYRGLGMRQYPS